jgi:hypothetical protein
MTDPKNLPKAYNSIEEYQAQCCHLFRSKKQKKNYKKQKMTEISPSKSRKKAEKMFLT